MLSARYLRARTVETAPCEVVAPGSGQVQLAPAFTGVCGTDLHIFHGDMDARVSTPAVIGHEVSAVVVEVGPDVEGWSAGDRVAVMPLRSDGTCPACLAGHAHVCQHLDFIGIDSPGSLQQRWTVPASTLVALPDGVSLRDGALVEPTAVAVHDVRRAAVTDGESVVVVGGGPVGVLIALVATASGGDVVVVELDAHRRRVAQGLGLATLDPAAVDVVAEVEARTGGAGAAVAFEVSGAAGGVKTAVAVLGVRGRLCQVAIHATPREVDLHRFFWRELTMVGARLYERADFETAVELVASGAVPADAIISRVVPLTDTASAFTALEGGGDVMKVLVDCRVDGEEATVADPAIADPAVAGRTGAGAQGPFDLTGSLAVVTGARRGIGMAMALALATAGADIIGVSAQIEDDGEAARAVRALGRSFEAVRTDLADRAAVTALGADLAGRERPVDVLVNNAGTIRRAPAVEHSDADFDHVLEVDLVAPFVLTRSLGAAMLERGRGKVIFTASLLSFQGGINVVGYTAAKSALAGVTRALANEWAARGVNVNAIAPGYITTDNTQALQDDPARSASIAERIPAGRWGRPQDIGGATVFLASRAADYVHGVVLPVDGGWLGR